LFHLTHSKSSYIQQEKLQQINIHHISKLFYICPTAFNGMKNKIPKTQLEIELTCEKIVLQQQVKKLKTHLQVLQMVLKGK